MKKGFLVLMVVSLLFNSNLALCKSKGISLEKQLFDKGNTLYTISRDLAALKEDLVAVYAEAPSSPQWHQIKMAVQKMVLSRRVSFLTSLSIREIVIISDKLKYTWCEGQKTAITASIKWTENDLKATKKIHSRINNEKASTILKKGFEQMDAAIAIYRQCDELLDQIVEQKRPTRSANT